MQLKDLVTPIDSQTDEELLVRLRGLRHRRNVLRPAKAAHAAKAAKKGGAARKNKVETLLEGLSQEEIAQLLLALGE